MFGVPGVQSGASAINDSGIVVGWFNPTNCCNAFIYRDGQVYDLNDYLDASGAGWHLQSATGINASGQITGYGLHNGQLSGFRLDPVIDNTPPVISGMPAVG